MLMDNYTFGSQSFSKDSRQVICNYEFDTDFVIHSNHAGNTWALSYDWIAYYNTHHRRFVRIPMPDIKMLKVDVRAFVTDEGELYLFPYESGDLYRFSLNSFDQDTLSTRLTTTPSHFTPSRYSMSAIRMVYSVSMIRIMIFCV